MFFMKKMLYSLISSLCLISLFTQSIDSQEFCDKKFKDKGLVTGAMSYNGSYFLVFRGLDVWSIEFNDESREFLEPKLMKDFIAVKQMSANDTLITGMIFSVAHEQCYDLNRDPNMNLQCFLTPNITIFYYYNKNGSDLKQSYQVYYLRGYQFINYHMLTYPEKFVPYYGKEKGYQNEFGAHFSLIRGAAYIRNKMKLYLISSMTQKLFVRQFTDPMRYVDTGPVIDTSFYGTTGGFELVGQPFFIINDAVYEFDANTMYYRYTVWDFFCKKTPAMTSKTTFSSSVTTSTEKTSTTKEPKITSEIHSSETTTRTTGETTSSTANTITSLTSRSPKSEDSDSLIYVIVGVVTLVLIIGCVITSLICWFLKNGEKDENLTKEERLLRAKQFIKDKKSETYRQKRLMKAKN